MSELHRIERLIAKARRKIRLQLALDAITLGLAVGLFGATLVVGLIKGHVLDEARQHLYLAACTVAPLAGLLWALLRRIDPIAVAAAIDRANGFDDRLASAYQFAREPETTPFMTAQIADTMRRLDGVDAGRAHTLQRPRDLMAVAIFALALVVMVLVQFPERQTGPRDNRPTPTPLVVEEEEIRTNLDPGMATFRKDQVEELIEKAEKVGNEEARKAAEELRELIEDDQKGEVTPEEFNKRLSSIAEKLKSNCEAVDLAALLADLKPLSPNFAADAYVAPLRDLVSAHKFSDAASKLDDMADDIVQSGAITAGLTEFDFYEKVDAAREKHLICEAKELEKVADKVEEAAAELAKDDMTKDLAKALQEGDQEAAAKEIEKIAEKIAQKEVSDKDIEKLAKLLELFADKIDINDPKWQKEFEKYKNLASKLEDKLKQKGNLTKKEQKQLDDARRNLSKLQRQKQKEERGEAGRRLKRLEQKMRGAADEMRKLKEDATETIKKGQPGDRKEQVAQDPKEGEGDQKSDEKGEGEKKDDIQDAMDELRKLNDDRKGEQAKKDIKDATDRMKEDAQRSQGSKKKKDDLGNDERANKIDDYLKRAKGQQPQDGQQGEKGQKGQKGGQSGEGGQQAQKGSGQGEKDGQEQGKEPGGLKAGKGHEDGMGARTADLAGQRDDTDLQGAKGKGPSKSETIKKASQSGFASRGYKDAYDEYEKAVEEVLEQENVPPGYRHYVRRYFDFIRPQDGGGS